MIPELERLLEALHEKLVRTGTEGNKGNEE
jgi:hypothetical protein